MMCLMVVVGCSSSSSTPAPTYNISGAVTLTGAALSGVTINLTGATAPATTDGTGIYTFTGLANGTYTVTPFKTGYTFQPASLVAVVSGGNVTDINFVATALPPGGNTYSISGTVSGGATSGVTITLSGDNIGAVATGAGGTYTISGLLAGNYTVTPSLSGYTFNPTSTPAVITNANLTAKDFVATAIPVPHDISGTVSGATSSGVTITVTGTATATTTTGSDGSYTVTVPSDGPYTVTPSKTGFTFNPISTAVTISGAGVTGKDFTATANVNPTYTLSGIVTGPWVEGVKITMTGAGNATTYTNASGNYTFPPVPAGTYTLTPSLVGYTYSPPAPAVVVSSNTTQNFAASSVKTSYSISGTVSKTTAKTGPISIKVYQSNCNGCGPVGGTVISAPGAYTIRGLQNGSYVVGAEMDALGTGIANATNPLGFSNTVTINLGNQLNVDVALADPAVPTPVTPTDLKVAPGNGSALVQYSPPKDTNGQEIATSYKIYWGTDTAASNGGNVPFTAQGDNHNVYFLSSLTNGSLLYFKMTALVGTTESAPSAVFGPVTIGATTGANTVSGTVTFPGTATGPMMVGVHSDGGGVYFTRIASPVSPQSYSVAGVASGSYMSFAIIDMNSNGMIGTGDLSNANDTAPMITVSGNTTSNLTLSSASAIAMVSTDNQFDGTNNYYNLSLRIVDGTKNAVAATLISGPNVAVPFDTGLGGSSNDINIGLNTISPAVGDTYGFKVYFSDLTTQIISGSVTAVLSSFAQNLVAQTTAPYTITVPLFTWAAPATPPAYYTYEVNLWGNNDSTNWYYPQGNDLPSSTLSVPYNVDGRASSSSLTVGHSYTWQVSVRDANRNSATRQTNYTP